MVGAEGTTATQGSKTYVPGGDVGPWVTFLEQLAKFTEEQARFHINLLDKLEKIANSIAGRG